MGERDREQGRGEDISLILEYIIVPHDTKGRQLNNGDEVLIRFKVVSVFDTSDGYRDCNLNLQAIDPTEDKLYCPFLTCNTRLVDKVES